MTVLHVPYSFDSGKEGPCVHRRGRVLWSNNAIILQIRPRLPLWLLPESFEDRIKGPPRIQPVYRGTSLMGKSSPLGPYIRTIPRVIWWSYGGGAVSYERGTPVDGVDTGVCCAPPSVVSCEDIFRSRRFFILSPLWTP